jgi:hypothetical protein
VSVKFAEETLDLAVAYRVIADDLRNYPDRQSRSVVVSANEYYIAGMTHQQVTTDPYYRLWRQPLLDIVNMGVPFVHAAGNSANKADRQPESDALPQLLQDDDIPMIIVGAVDYHGKRADFSQLGRVSTLYAPGVNVECHTKSNGISVEKTGTSFGMLDLPSHYKVSWRLRADVLQLHHKSQDLSQPT